MNDGSGQTTEEKLQNEIAGDDTLLIFTKQGESEPFYKDSFKQGVTFEWVKSKVADSLEAKYEDLELYTNGKRIPEPFCLVDMGVQSGAQIEVKIAEGALVGADAIREAVLRELEEEAKREAEEEQ